METIKVKRALGILTINENEVKDLLDNKPMLESILLMLILNEETFENNWEVEFSKKDAMIYLKEYFLTQSDYSKDFILKTFSNLT